MNIELFWWEETHAERIELIELRGKTLRQHMKAGRRVSKPRVRTTCGFGGHQPTSVTRPVWFDPKLRLQSLLDRI